MTTTTMNGWSLTGVPLATIAAGGHSTRVRAGAVATVLGHVARRFHAEVEALVTFYGWRSVATNAAVGGHPRSNHPSGTAFDANGYAHPYRAPVNFTAAQVAAIRRILAEVAPVVRWGGDFGAALRDGMHFEIVGSAAQVAAVAARLTTQEDDMDDAQDKSLSECRRMLGVLFGWQPAQGPEAGALAALRTTGARGALTDTELNAIQLRVNAALVTDIIRGDEFKGMVAAIVKANLPTGAGGVGGSLEQIEAAVKAGLATLTLKSV